MSHPSQPFQVGVKRERELGGEDEEPSSKRIDAKPEPHKHEDLQVKGEPQFRIASDSISQESSEEGHANGDGFNCEDESNFVPTEFIKEELKSELGLLGPLEEPIYMNARDVEEEEVGSGRESDDEPDDEDDLNIEKTGPVRIAGVAPRPFLRTRSLKEMEEMRRPPPSPDEILEKKKLLPTMKKRAFYNPRLWAAGAQDPVLFKKSNKEALYRGKVKCFETEVTLEGDDDCSIGSLWKEIRGSEYEPEGEKRTASPSIDRTDFLKACMRMGSMMDPEKMTALLGGRHRTEDYCRFAMAAMLGILNNFETRQKIRDDRMVRSNYRCADVHVYADEMYASDDELALSAGVLEEKLERAKHQPPPCEAEGGITDVSDIPIEDDAYGDTDEPQRPFEELQSLPAAEEEFNDILSFVHRSYFANLMGSVPDNITLEMYLKWAVEKGMGFENDKSLKLSPGDQGDIQPIINNSLKRHEDRSKWRTEPMPAPELGPGASVTQGPVELWKHASKRFSVKHMTRLSLLQPDRILDWLTYVTVQESVADDLAAYLKDSNPVVSIAPIPLLHLADLMSDYVLKVLSVATVMAIEDQKNEDAIAVISRHEIYSAAVFVTEKYFKERKGHYYCTEVAIDESGFALPPQWPVLIQRPLTTGEEFLLCSETPRNSFRVPLQATDEARIILDSTRKISRHFLYIAAKTFGKFDPFKNRDVRRKPEGKNGNKVTGYKKENVALKTEPDVKEGGPAENISTTLTHEPSSVKSPEVPLNSSRNGGSIPAAKAMQIDVSTNGECSFDLREKDFDATLNTAYDMVKKVGREVFSKRLKARAALSHGNRKPGVGPQDKPLEAVLTQINSFKSLPDSTISLHRLGRLCLHALGQRTEEDEGKLMSFGSRAHYTRFGEFGTPDKVRLSFNGLTALTGFADQIVRHEAEILQACAAHDDGRPWIDRADVVLVSSVRKEPYIYGDLCGSSTLT